MDASSPLAIREGPAPPWQVPLIAHAFCGVIGFALFLPTGAILARYVRTFRPWWYTAHWIVQLTAGLFIITGVSLGFLADHELGGSPWDNHKRTGIVLLVLYIAQCVIGAVIHFVKPKGGTRRPIQNYFHAILGLSVLVLGMYQIRTGYAMEWPRYMDSGALPSWVNTLWIVWSLILVIAYAAGMVFIRKQYAQEAAARLRSSNMILGALEARRQSDFDTLRSDRK
ncbi:hypothetical protein B0H19DRAFT_544248 [Mycena capillaripes]|nr:hypothetical protein B0H19DRAFT_544248 [Mycena capillaripes]